MRSAHTVEQVRAAESTLMAQLPEGALMQRAATGLAVAIADLLGRVYAARVLLLVGPGDNGGDALWAGAMLARRGAAVEAVLLSATRSIVEGLAALRADGGRAVLAAEAHRPDVVVDGIVGIGGRPGLRDEAAEALARSRASRSSPSTCRRVWTSTPAGSPDRHVSADLTVTFGTLKVAHLVDPAAQRVRCRAPGRHRPRPSRGAGRGAAARRRGRAAAGARAVRAQVHPRGRRRTRRVADLSRCCGPVHVGCGVRTRRDGALLRFGRRRGPRAASRDRRSEGRVQAWVVGSGGDTDAEAALADALADGVPTVVDADALMHVEKGPRGLVLTPHAGELARMLGVERSAVEADQLSFARRAAQEYDAVVLLKGRHTLVARPDGRVRVTTSGVPWLAVAGAGDVLAGVIGSLLAAGLDPFDAASAGSWLHGAAAALASGGGPLTATRVADAIPEVVRDLRP